MFRFVKMEFMVPQEVKNSIDNGDYEIIGGMVRRVLDGEAVLWLTTRDDTIERLGNGIKIAKATVSIISMVPLDMGLSITFVGYGFLLGLFTHKKNGLEEILQKIDQTQFAQLEAGLHLAVDAEVITNTEQAVQQIINSRQSIEQGLSYFAQELRKYQKKEVESHKIIDLINLITIGHLASVRSYLWTNDYSLAKNRLTRLHLIVIESRIILLNQMRGAIQAKVGLKMYLRSWHLVVWSAAVVMTAVSWPFTVAILIAYMSYKVGKEFISIEDIDNETEDLEKHLRAKKEKVQKIITNLKQVSQKFNVDFNKFNTTEIDTLENVEHFIDHYLAEVENHRTSNKPFLERLKSIPVAEAKN